MRILFDQGTPRPLRSFLRPHVVVTTLAKGWDRLRNGELLDAAERDGFDILVTTDKQMQHQQNLTGRSIAVIVLARSKWPEAKLSVSQLQEAIEHARAGTCTLI